MLANVVTIQTYLLRKYLVLDVVAYPNQLHEAVLLGMVCVEPSRAGGVLNIARCPAELVTNSHASFMYDLRDLR